MKYKRIIDDKGYLKALLRKVNAAAVARAVGVTKSYIYHVMRDKYILSEEMYRKIKRAAEEIDRN
jgi:hypothetical protein